MTSLGGGVSTTAPGRPFWNPALLNLKWGDTLYQRESAQKMRYISMPQEQWERGVASHLAAHPHNWTVHQWIAKTQAARLEHQARASQRIVVEMPDSDELTFRVWKDMIENPCQYGNDIVEWLDLDAQVMAGPKRWRAGAYWTQLEEADAEKESARLAEEDRKRQHELATRIQALWRGYSARCLQPWRDCAHCLTHGICVEQVNGQSVCRDCYDDGCHRCGEPCKSNYCSEDCSSLADLHL